MGEQRGFAAMATTVNETHRSAAGGAGADGATGVIPMEPRGLQSTGSMRRITTTKRRRAMVLLAPPRWCFGLYRPPGPPPLDLTAFETVQYYVRSYTVDQGWFDALIMAIIVANSVTLAMADPVNTETPTQRTLAMIDLVFLAIFTVEMVLKMFSLGLFSSTTFDRCACRAQNKAAAAVESRIHAKADARSGRIGAGVPTKRERTAERATAVDEGESNETEDEGVIIPAEDVPEYMAMTEDEQTLYRMVRRMEKALRVVDDGEMPGAEHRRQLTTLAVDAALEEGIGVVDLSTVNPAKISPDAQFVSDITPPSSPVAPSLRKTALSPIHEGDAGPAAKAPASMGLLALPAPAASTSSSSRAPLATPVVTPSAVATGLSSRAGDASLSPARRPRDESGKLDEGGPDPAAPGQGPSPRAGDEVGVDDGETPPPGKRKKGGQGPRGGHSLVYAVPGVEGLLGVDAGEVVSSLRMAADGVRRRNVAAAAANMGGDAYFDSWWNLLDFVIVVAGLISLSPSLSGAGANAIRLLRVLRPLRSINRLEGLKVIIGALLDSMRGLAQVLFLLSFLFIIFGIIALQLWNGVLHRSCFDEANPPAVPPPYDPREDAFAVAGFCMPRDEPGDGQRCGSGLVCLPRAQDPGYGTISFDNFGLALLNIYITTTLANWTQILYSLQDAVGSAVPGIYFVVLILVCTFFAMNLVLAVVVSGYGENARAVKQARLLSTAVSPAEVEAELFARQMLPGMFAASAATGRGRRFPPTDLVAGPRRPSRGGDDDTGDTGDTGAMAAAAAGALPLDRVSVKQASDAAASDAVESKSDAGGGRLRMSDLEDGEEQGKRDGGGGGGGGGARGRRGGDDGAVGPAQSPPSASSARTGTGGASTAMGPRSLRAVGSAAGFGVPDEAMGSPSAESAESPERSPPAGTGTHPSLPPRLASGVRGVSGEDVLSPAAAGGAMLTTPDRTSRASARDTTTMTTTMTTKSTPKTASASAAARTPLRDRPASLAPPPPAFRSASTMEGRSVPGGGMLIGAGALVVHGARARAALGRGRADGVPGGSPPSSMSRFVSAPLARPKLAGKMQLAARMAAASEELRRRSDKFTSPSERRREKVRRREARQAREEGVRALRVASRSTSGPAGSLPPPGARTHTSGTTHSAGHGPATAQRKSTSERVSTIDDAEDEPLETEADVARRFSLAVRFVQMADEQLRARNAWLVGKPNWVLATSRLAEHPWFSAFIVAAIFVNTVILAVDHYGIDPTLYEALETVNTVLSGVFAAEMVIKLLGMGPAEYVADRFNVFDAVVVFFSVVELVVTAALGPDVASEASALTVLRAFRLLRVLKLARNIKSLRILLVTILDSLADIGYMTLLLFLFIFLFAVLGRQLFGGAFADFVYADGEAPPHSFSSFSDAVFVVFLVITGDNWPGVMQDTVAAVGDGGPIAYFLVLQAFGAYVVLSLFIAILLERFSEQTDESFDDEDVLELAQSIRLKENSAQLGQPLTLGSPIDAAVKVAEQMCSTEERREGEVDAKRRRYYTKYEPAVIDYSLGFLGPENPLRIACFNVVTTRWFEVLVIVVILLNCIFLALERPGLDEASTLAQVLSVGDILFTVFFSVEAAAKIVALGAVTPGIGYFRSGWNILDFFVVVVSILSLSFPTFTPLRALRSLRPLRVIVRSKQIQVVVQALFYALPNIVNVFLLTILFWVIFGILGVSFYKGAFYSCSDPAITTEANCVGTFVPEDANNGTAVEREWTTPEANFDNVAVAALTLFQVATLSDWGSVALNGVAARGPGEAPQSGTNPGQIFFFYAFIIIGSFFALNLFVGVVIDNFNRLKEELDGSAFQTAEQRQWTNAQRLIQTVRLEGTPDPPEDPIRGVAFSIVTHEAFDKTIMAFIVINTFTMCLEHYNSTNEWTVALDVLNYFFTVVFFLEAAFKIAGLSLRVYLRDNWNRFDGTVVILSIVGLFVDAGVGASVVRVFRIARVLRIIKRAETLKNLFDTLLLSLPSLWNIGGLVFVLFFIFAVLGTTFFGTVPLGDVDELGISRHANFATFGMSMLTLWRLATGDAWETVLYAAQAHDPVAAPIYFVVFQIVVSFIMVQLFIAVILENFAESQEKSHKQGEMEQIVVWGASWSKYDPLSLKVLPASLFPRVMGEAPPPFGFGTTLLSNGQVLHRLLNLQVPIFKRPAEETFAGAGAAVRQALYEANAKGPWGPSLSRARTALPGGLRSRRPTLGFGMAARTPSAATTVTGPPAAAATSAPGGGASVAGSGAPSVPPRMRLSPSPGGATPVPEDGASAGAGGGAAAGGMAGLVPTMAGSRRASRSGGLTGASMARQGPHRSLAVRKWPRPERPKMELVWVADFTKTMYALARKVINLDVALEEEADQYFMHDYWAVHMIGLWYLRIKARRSSDSDTRSQGSLHEPFPSDVLGVSQFGSDVVGGGGGAPPPPRTKAGGRGGLKRRGRPSGDRAGDGSGDETLSLSGEGPPQRSSAMGGWPWSKAKVAPASGEASAARTTGFLGGGFFASGSHSDAPPTGSAAASPPPSPKPSAQASPPDEGGGFPSTSAGLSSSAIHRATAGASGKSSDAAPPVKRNASA